MTSSQTNPGVSETRLPLYVSESERSISSLASSTLGTAFAEISTLEPTVRTDRCFGASVDTVVLAMCERGAGSYQS